MRSFTLTILAFLTVLSLALARSPPRCRRRRVVIVNPDTLFDPVPFKFSHISVDTITRVAHFAGHVPLDINGNIIGATLDEQLAATEKNLRLSLKAVKAEQEDILRLLAFIRNFDPATDLTKFQVVDGNLGAPPSTVVGVTALALEGLLVEIEMDVAVSKRTANRLAKSACSA